MIQILMTARLSNKFTPRTEELPEVSKAKTSFIDNLLYVQNDIQWNGVSSAFMFTK